jgi:hypothetical protein
MVTTTRHGKKPWIGALAVAGAYPEARAQVGEMSICTVIDADHQSCRI